MIIVPQVPSEVAVNALSLGDKQFYFRYLGFIIQNAGDSWGRFTALRDYDYQELAQWFALLDQLDPVSNYIPSLAGYYYSHTQNRQDTIYVVRYLVKHAMRDPKRKWWWLAQAVYIANHLLEDKALALEIAYQLANLPQTVIMPLWARQMPAFIHEQLGQKQAATKIIVDLLLNLPKLSQGEYNFMEHFIVERMEDPEIFEQVKQALATRGFKINEPKN